jgi:arabinan endo-1,5-alpha-L-arabinosidase
VRFGNAIGEHSAQIRRMFWLDSGWPVVSPMTYRGEPGGFDQDLACSAASGTWQVVDFRDVPDLLPAAHDREAPCTRSRTLECAESLTEFGLVEGAVFNVILPLADGDATVSAFSGYAQDGVSGKLTAVFGIKV